MMTEIERKKLLDQIEHLIEKKDFEALKEVLAEARSSDVAEVVEVLDEIARQILFDLLDPKDAGEVLEKVDEATRSELVDDLTSAELTNIVATLSPDDAADVVGELSDIQSEQILDRIPETDSHQIEKLLRYPEDTAGGIMTTTLVKVKDNGTIRDAIHAFRDADPEDDFYSVFVVDDQNKLKGMVGMDTMLRNHRNTPVADVLEEDLTHVNVNADQEEIANIFRKNDLIVMPVVDENGVLLGRITVDDIVDVMEEEAEEDVLMMAGTHPAELDTRGIFRAATIRLPWLLTCMTSSMIAGMFFIGHFVDKFPQVIWNCIIVFMPAIAAIGGNSGMQTSTIVVRGLASGDLAALDVFQVFLREIRVAFLAAMVCGGISATAATCWLHYFPKEGFDIHLSPIIGITVGLAMLCTIVISTLMGLSLPFFFRKVGIDPAISSGPLVTTANDGISYLVYFSLALLLLKWLG